MSKTVTLIKQVHHSQIVYLNNVLQHNRKRIHLESLNEVNHPTKVPSKDIWD